MISRFAIVTDWTVGKLVGGILRDAFLQSNISVLYKEIEPGEDSKSRDTKGMLEDWLAQNGYGRDSCLIALGGGVIGDLVGFVAATYMRGISFVQIPTTLLAMVDSSLGGKTGINTQFAKNMVGAFYHPELIYLDINVLKTLPMREFCNGMAEVIKTAAVRDESIFDLLENHCDRVLACDEEMLAQIVFTIARHKLQIVAQDEHDVGVRCILNWGHTIGHAIEAILAPHWLHGECVAVGMILESHLALKMGYLVSPFVVTRMQRVLESFQLPIRLPNLDHAQLINKMGMDKKNTNSMVRCVMLQAIGKAVESPVPVPITSIQSVLYPALQINPILQTIHGSVCIPGSKSISNRALLLAALGSGVCKIQGLLHADDTRVMIDALQQMGVTFSWQDHGRICCVHNVMGYLKRPSKTLYLGNAGTAARFLTTLCTLIPDGNTILTGDSRLKERPIQDLTDALISNGNEITFLEKHGHFPFQVKGGRFRGGHVRLKADVSSQFVSSILLSASQAEESITLELKQTPVSQPYIDMTVQVLQQFGIRVEKRVPQPDRQTNVAIEYCIPAGKYTNPSQFVVEADATSASYFLALAALTGGRITIPNLFPKTSTQGDAAFYTILEKMGCTIEILGDGGICVKGPADGKLKGIHVDLAAMTDTFVTLAVVAAVSEGRTRITNISNQRLKECNRIAAMVTELRKCGVWVEELEDGLEIEGCANQIDKLHAAEIECYNDHRIAMSFAILGCRVPGITILDKECVSKTYPTFWNDLESLGIVLTSVLPSTSDQFTSASTFPIILVGMRASGKTLLGKGASSLLDVEFVDMDAVFVEHFEMSIQEYVAKNSWASFRKKEVHLLRQTVSKKTQSSKRVLIATGGGIVETEEGRILLQSYKPFVVQISRDINDIKVSLEQDQSRANLNEPIEVIWNRRKPFYQQCSEYEFRIRPGEQDWKTCEQHFARFLTTCLLRPQSSDFGNDFFLSLTCSQVEDILPVLNEMSSDVDALELRIDLLKSLDPDFIYHQISLLRQHTCLPIIFTLRSVQQGGKFQSTSEQDYFNLLTIGKRSACEFIDIEACWSADSISQFLSSKHLPFRIISSFHDYSTTPTEGFVRNLFLQCHTRIPSASVLKVVIKAQTVQDSLIVRNAVTSLQYPSSLSADQLKSKHIIALAVGSAGRLSRVLNEYMTPVTHPKLSAPAAPGQLAVFDLLQLAAALGIEKKHKFYLFGTPITHSPSPLIHNTGFRFHNLPCEYFLFDTTSIEKISHRLRHPTFEGGSVTIPYKQTIIPYLDQLSDHAKAIGAVNTIKKRGTCLVGENTDWLALYELIQARMKKIHNDPNVNLSNFQALILGAGGTASAACYALQQLHFKATYICNRTREKAQVLAKRFGFQVCEFDQLPLHFFDLIVSTLPPTLSPPLQLPESLFQNPKLIAVEVVYRPRFTSLLQQAKKAGCPFIEGIEVLLAQALVQFEIFSDSKPAPKLEIVQQLIQKLFSNVSHSDLPLSFQEALSQNSS